MLALVHGLVEVLIPPASLSALALAGGLLAIRWRLIGRILVVAAAAGLFLFSLPITAQLLIAPLEAGLPLAPPPDQNPGAIVILGGDVARGAGGAITVGGLTLERLRAGARLAKKSGLPILVSGGALRPGEPSVGQLMAQSLRQDFGVSAAWIEGASGDTWQNARFSEAILRRHHIASIYVVTQAWHMRRSLIAFAPLSVTVTAAPTQLDPLPSFAWDDFVPQVKAWRMSYFALHEWIGCTYYELREW
ncbi:MAG TPA: YdcF family protein [Stellaceae bacterium]|nr:YdcF family protein [Stellaceae bacterium]